VAGRVARVCFIAYLLALPAYCIARMLGHASATLVLTYAIPALLSAFGLTHAAATRGLRSGMLMFVSAFALALSAETLGATTGIPFGPYSYTDTLGAKVFGVVPVLIPLAWMMIAYPAWETVRLLFARMPARIVAGALAITAYDLSLDPRMVSDGHWLWPQGGAYFGIPLSNFVGWVITAFVILLVWSRLDTHAARTPSHTLGVLAFVVLWIGEAMAQALFWNGPLVGAIVFLAMGLFGAPALLALVRGLNHEATTGMQGE
jgi:uncharacterized membrane protein